jgi:hypothetical protein
MAFLTAAAAVYLVGCFSLAAGAKWRAFPGFAVTIAEVAPFLPARGTAGAVIAIEAVIALAIGGGLAIGSRDLVAIGASLAIGCAFGFAGAIGMVLRRGDPVSCHCFGGESNAISPTSLLGPVAVGIAGLAVARGGTWPASPAVWTASLSAGVYVLIAHLLLSGHASHPA